MQNSTAPWWKGAVIYQIYPRSFCDSNGDGIGDLKGIVQKLEYVAGLGVDAIWISPFFTSPMVDFGYDVADYTDVDPEFGTLDDFKDLVATAHSLDLRVIIDQVYSHSSNKHPWFEKSRQSRSNRKADWYVWSDPKPDGSAPNNWQSVFGNPSWSWDNRRKQYYLHNFLPQQPDLNLHNVEVQNALIDVARFWLDLGVDGFRLDAINFGMHDLELRDNPPANNVSDHEYRPYSLQKHVYDLAHPKLPEFLERLRAAVDDYGDIFTVAEVGGKNPDPTMKAYTEGNNRLNSAYSFDFLSLTQIKGKDVEKILAQWPGDTDEGWPSWAFSNHDAARVATRWKRQVPSQVTARLYLLLLACLRGNVFIYQGEELGLTQAEIAFEDLQDPEAINNWPDNLGRDGARTPFPWDSKMEYVGFSSTEPWLPIWNEHRELAVDAQTDGTGSVLDFARSIIKLRRERTALRLGSLEFVEAAQGLTAFRRSHGDESLLCVFNLTDSTLSVKEFDFKELVIGTSTDDRHIEPMNGIIAVT